MISVRRKQRLRAKQRPKKRRTCFTCLHGSAYDSDLEKTLPKHAYCRKYGLIVLAGHAKICALFEPYAPPLRRKNKRRW